MLGAVPEQSARLGRDTEGSPVSGVKDAPASTARPAGSVAGEQRRGRPAQTVGDSREGERSAASAEWGGRTGRETESRLGNSVQSAASLRTKRRVLITTKLSVPGKPGGGRRVGGGKYLKSWSSQFRKNNSSRQ